MEAVESVAPLRKKSFVLKFLDRFLNFLAKLRCVCVSKCCNMKCNQNNYLTEKQEN